MLAESYPKAAIPVVEHLTSHQRVEHSRAGQWDAKVEAKQPPVLCIPVELDVKTIAWQKEKVTPNTQSQTQQKEQNERVRYKERGDKIWKLAGPTYIIHIMWNKYSC